MNAAPRSFRPGVSGRCLIVACCAALLCGCQEPNVYQEPPPPPVTVANPAVRTVVQALEFTGTTQPFASVDIRARVEGFLESIDFVEGTAVKAGDLLFQIDPKPFEATLAQAEASEKLAVAQRATAQAEVESNKAELKRAKDDVQRVERANRLTPGAVTEDEIQTKRTSVLTAQAAVDASLASVASAEAQIAAAKALVIQAELDLGYCRVTSPIDGRVSRRLVDIGNLVGAGESTLLTTVITHDPVYVYFNVNENDLLKFIDETITKDGRLPSEEIKLNQPIELGLGDDDAYPFRGVAEYTDSVIDASTGTCEIRGVLENESRRIPPGAFARVRVPLQELEALLIDPRAVSRDQTGAFLLVVGGDDVVERRNVELVGKYDGLQAVAGDIGPKDRVIVNGLQRARPGAKVSPQMEEPKSSEARVAKPTEEPETETPASEHEE